MIRHEREAAPVIIAEDECRHHWVIESPSGPTSRGVCKLCGTEKEFQNLVREYGWGSDTFDSTKFRDVENIDPDREWDDN